MNKHRILFLLLAFLPVACAPFSRSPEPAASGATPTALNMDDPMVQDAALFAQQEGLSLEEGVRRMSFQKTIGDIQPRLAEQLPESYGGLWVEHQPEYRIVIGLTEGDKATIAPYVEDKPWADYVFVQPVTFSLQALEAAQASLNELVQELGLSVATAVDVKNNRVELIVGNPQLLQADLDAAGIELPQPVVMVPINTSEPLPETNEGLLLEVEAADGRILYLPKQPPTAASMAALLEGELVEVDGCLRVMAEGYADGFFILWPHDTEIKAAEEKVELLNGVGEVVARVGEWLRLGGGAMENSLSMSRFDQLIPGMPLANCSGPYWVAGQLETMAEQGIADIYVNPFSSNGRLLALFISQSRPSAVEGSINGELNVDGEGCLRVGDYVVFWPPGSYIIEDPLRVMDRQRDILATVGETVILLGAEKSAADYRYFDNKMNCSGPYWGVSEAGETGASGD